MSVIVAALGVACGPESPGDSDGSSSGGTEPPSSASEAPGSTTDGPTPGAPTTGDSSTTDAPTTGEPSTTDAPTTDESTTTGEPTCPVGQPSLAPLWSRTLPVSEEPDVRAGLGIGVLDDGTIVVEGSTRVGDVAAPGVFRVAGDGGTPEWRPGALTPGGDFSNVGLRVTADGSIVVVGKRAAEPVPELYVARFAADGTELARVELQSAGFKDLWNFELDGEAIVVLGNGADQRQRVARVDPNSGASEWEVELPALEPLPGPIAVGPGGEVVVGHGIWPNGGDPEFKVWRVDAGVVAWERDLLPPEPSAGQLSDLVVTPGGEIVALEARLDDPARRLVATGLALADGAPLWELDVAVEDASGVPTAPRWLVDDDALTLAVVRSADGKAPKVEVHRVSFDGVHLGVTPVATDGVTAPEFGLPFLRAARGACGELILFQSVLASPWLAAFAP